MAKTLNIRLCERATLYGIDTLSDAELLAVTTGLSRDALQKLLDRHSVFELMASLNLIEMSPDEKIRLEAVFLLTRRLSRAQYSGGVIIRRPEDIGPLFVGELQFRTGEVVLAALLNTRHRLVRIETLAAGGVSSAVIDPREVARAALASNASAIILGHNHPSGDATPSPEDVATTKSMTEALSLLNLHLIDHLVVGGSSFISMKQQGLI